MIDSKWNYIKAEPIAMSEVVERSKNLSLYYVLGVRD